MTTRFDGIVKAVCATPWAIQPERLEAILELVQLRAQGGQFTPDEVQARIADGKGTRADVRRQGKVAVLPVYGVISQRMNAFSAISGGTSTDVLGKQFQALVDDPEVSAIVLDVDSPGGRVEGVEELATKIHAARGSKPIIAVANSLMASAAYWIGSAADEVVATPSASVGSIGVFTVHQSFARAAANEGWDFTVLRAGKYKAEGLPYEPLSADARAYVMSQLEDTYETFTAAVARGRGVNAAVVRERFGEGRVFIGRRAQDAGLVDRLATLDEVIADLTSGAPRRNGRKAMTAGAEILGIVAAAPEPTPDVVPLATAAVPQLTLVRDPVTEGAGTDATSTLDTSAPQAEPKETVTVSDKLPAAPGAGPSDESGRFAAFLQLAQTHGKGVADVTAWAASGKSVEDVRAELLASYAKEAKPAAVVRVGEERELAKPFASLGEQLLAVRKAALNPHAIDKRLLDINATATGMGEQIGSDGGFAIQNDLLQLALEPMYEKSAILSRVRRVPIGAGRNGAKFWVIDEESRATGSRFGGLQMQWVAEGDTVVPKKPKLRKMEVELKKLIGFAYVTDEELEDVGVMGTLLETAYREESEFMLEDSVINGAAAGPLGILQAKCTRAIAIEGGQTIANTPASLSKNVANMKVAVPPKLWQNGIWLANPEFEPALINATMGGTNIPIYLPPGGLSAAPYGQLLGRPVIFTEYNPAVGTPGDIMFAALSEYLMADKNGVRTAWSSHVQFLTEQQCFRISMRADGQPLWKDAVAPAKGSVSRTPFVTLAARA